MSEKLFVTIFAKLSLLYDSRFGYGSDFTYLANAFCFTDIVNRLRTVNFKLFHRIEEIFYSLNRILTLTKPELVAVLSSVRYKMLLSSIKIHSAAFSYSSLVQVLVLFLLLSTAANEFQLPTDPAFVCRIQIDSGPKLFI